MTYRGRVMRNNKVSTRELVFSAASSRFFVLIANLQGFGKINLAEIILAEFISYLIVYITYIFLKKRNFPTNKAVRYIVALYLVVVVISTAFTLSYFTTNNLSYNYSYLLIPILALLISLYLANNGIEGVSRFSLIVVGFVVVSLLALFFVSKVRFSTANFESEAISLYNIFFYTSINFEVVILFLFKDNTKVPSFKTIDSLNKLSFFVPTVAYIFTVAVLGYGIIIKYDFPLNSIVDFVCVESGYNLSYLFTALLIVVAIARISFATCSVLKLIGIRKIGYILPTVVVTATVILLRKLLIAPTFNAIIYFTVPLVLIALTLLTSKKENKR